MNPPIRPISSARTTALVVLALIGLGRPGLAQQNNFAVIEIYNAADDVDISYELRWGQKGYHGQPPGPLLVGEGGLPARGLSLQ